MSTPKINKSYIHEMELFKRSWIVGTPEYEKRKSYPGFIPKQCNHPCCVYSTCKEIENTYWMCSECLRQAPDIYTWFKSAPSKTIVEPENRKSASKAVFQVYCMNRLKGASLSDAGVPTATPHLEQQ